MAGWEAAGRCAAVVPAQAEEPVVAVRLSCRLDVPTTAVRILPLPCRCHRRMLHRGREKRNHTRLRVRQRQLGAARPTVAAAGMHGQQQQSATADEVWLFEDAVDMTVEVGQTLMTHWNKDEAVAE